MYPMVLNLQEGVSVILINVPSFLEGQISAINYP